MKNILSVIRRTLSVYSKNEMNVYAGHSTLCMLTAAFPFLMLLLAIINMIPGYTVENVTDLIFRIIPDVDEIRTLVTSMVTNLKSQSGGLLASVSALTTLWSASGGVRAIRSGLKRITPGSLQAPTGILLGILYTLLFIILIPALLIFQVLGDTIRSLLMSLSAMIGISSVAETISSVLQYCGFITIIIAGLILLLTYTYLPGGRRSLKSQLPGAVFAAVAWQIFSFVFAKIMPGIWKYSLYGSLASLFLMIMWLRIMLMILFYGASLNTALQTKEPEPQETEETEA